MAKETIQATPPMVAESPEILTGLEALAKKPKPLPPVERPMPKRIVRTPEVLKKHIKKDGKK